jgi:predicted Zn-ribbon and HTH transcriptional regulator
MSPQVEIDRFRNYSDAAMAKALLEVAGIRCTLTDSHSSDLFVGTFSATGVEVAAADAARARELLEQSRKVARARRAEAAAHDRANEGGSGDDGDEAAETCLSCGAALAAAAVSCPACGFTFEGEEIHLYANGPLPDSLLAQAFTPADSQRFALPAEQVQRYVDWCGAAGLLIVGWETWLATALGHQVREQQLGEAGALCLAARAVLAQGDRAAVLRFSPTATAAAANGSTGDDRSVTPSS